MRKTCSMKRRKIEGADERKIRKKMAEKLEGYGRGPNSLGGRRQALLGLTQHRRLKASADWGTHHLDSGFLDSPLELIKRKCPGVELVRLPVCRQPKEGREVKCVTIARGREGQSSIFHTPPVLLTCHLGKNQSPSEATQGGGPFLLTPFPPMTWIESLRQKIVPPSGISCRS